MPRMLTPIDDNEWWTLIESLLQQPKPWRKKNAGRFSESDRAALSGILYVFKSGLRCNHFPISQVFGLFATRRRRLRDWNKARACGPVARTATNER